MVGKYLTGKKSLGHKLCANYLDPIVKRDNYDVIIAICAILGFFMFSLLPVALELSIECNYIDLIKRKSVGSPSLSPPLKSN